jgi:putative endonuclease
VSALFGWMRILYLAGDWLRRRAQERLVAQGTLAPHRANGMRGEDLAHRYLQRQGMRIVARNWRTRSASAEIDLVAWDEPDGDATNGEGGVLVFVEVKTRASDEINAPERQIDGVKRRNMARGAAEFVRRFAVGQERIRFDVVSIVLRREPEIRHFRDAFHVGGLETRKADPMPHGTRATVAGS